MATSNYRMKSVLLTSLFLRAVSSQSTIITLPFFDSVDQQPIVASIIAANPTATTYLINCPSGESPDSCGFPNSGATITLGASLYDFYLAVPAEATASLHCTLTGTMAAQCTQSFAGTAANNPGVSTSTYTGDELEYLPVTVTAGLDLLSTVSATSTPASSSIVTTSSGTLVVATTSAAVVTTSSSVVVISTSATVTVMPTSALVSSVTPMTSALASSVTPILSSAFSSLTTSAASSATASAASQQETSSGTTSAAASTGSNGSGSGSGSGAGKIADGGFMAGVMFLAALSGAL